MIGVKIIVWIAIFSIVAWLIMNPLTRVGKLLDFLIYATMIYFLFTTEYSVYINEILFLFFLALFIAIMGFKNPGKYEQIKSAQIIIYFVVLFLLIKST